MVTEYFISANGAHSMEHGLYLHYAYTCPHSYSVRDGCFGGIGHVQSAMELSLHSLQNFSTGLIDLGCGVYA